MASAPEVAPVRLPGRLLSLHAKLHLHANDTWRLCSRRESAAISAPLGGRSGVKAGEEPGAIREGGSDEGAHGAIDWGEAGVPHVRAGCLRLLWVCGGHRRAVA